jgi:RNA polymerase sigma factor (TIGR02999 family)
MGFELIVLVDKLAGSILSAVASRMQTDDPGHVTQILNSLEQGQVQASADLLPLVYEELRKLAASRLSHESSGQTLQATALVHEAYVRLVDVRHKQRWDSRGHFFAAAAEAMRRILLERARRKSRLKHGGELERVELPDEILAGDASGDDILALDEALKKLDDAAPDKCQLVKLRFFAGLTNEQAAEALGISCSTADRYWSFARAWLFREVSGAGKRAVQ